MANISDMIADFIDSVIGDDDSVQLSRNELANYFAVAPSQINYVLSTRFSLDKGSIVESKRGGGGFITVIKLSDDGDTVLEALLEDLDKTQNLSDNRAQNFIERLEREEIVSDREAVLMRAALSDKALSLPVNLSGTVRKNIFREMIVHLIKESD